MKVIHGKHCTIDKAIVGKISLRPPLLSASRKICVTKNMGWRISRCRGVIYTGSADVSPGHKQYVCCESSDVADHLVDNDIVKISPSGEIIKLFDATSVHNSLFVTARCNCRCVMCPQMLSDNDEMSEDEIVQRQVEIIRLMSPQTKSIGITGGEPTLLGNGLIEIVRACKKYLPRTAVTILSNGILFSDLEYAKSLALVGHHDLVVAVALYADNDTEHDNIVRRRGAFYKTVQGLHNLALCHQRVEIRNVVHSLTYKRLPQYSEFVYRNFPYAIHVALMGMEVTESAKANRDMLWIEPCDLAAPLANAVSNLSQRDMHVSIYNMPLCVLPQEMENFCVRSISDWKQAYSAACESCSKLGRCGGYFESAEQFWAPHIKPF